MGIFGSINKISSLTGTSGGGAKNSSNSSLKNQRLKVERGKDIFFKKVRVGDVREKVGNTVRVNGEELSAKNVREDIGEMVGRETLSEGLIKKRLFEKKYDRTKRNKIISLLRNKYAKQAIEKLKSDKGGEIVINKKRGLFSRTPKKEEVIIPEYMRARDESIDIGLKRNKQGRVTAAGSDVLAGKKKASVGETVKSETMANPNRPNQSEFASPQTKGGKASASSSPEKNTTSVANIGKPAKFDDEKPANEKPTDIKLAA